MYPDKELSQLFSECFKDRFTTLLLGGFEEPIYLPAMSSEDKRYGLLQAEYKDVNNFLTWFPNYSIIGYRQDYAQSLLHEVAHWCVAGRGRREQVDYGYWYEADGRNDKQQAEFYQVEILPQSIEWIFTDALKKPFSPSFDNLNMDELSSLEQLNRAEFKANLVKMVAQLKMKIKHYWQDNQQRCHELEKGTTLSRIAELEKSLIVFSEKNQYRI